MHASSSNNHDERVADGRSNTFHEYKAPADFLEGPDGTRYYRRVDSRPHRGASHSSGGGGWDEGAGVDDAEAEDIDSYTEVMLPTLTHSCLLAMPCPTVSP